MKKYIFILSVFCLATCSSKPESRLVVNSSDNKEQKKQLAKKIQLNDDLFKVLEDLSFVKSSPIKKGVHAYSQFRNGIDSLSKEGYRFLKSSNEKFWIDVVTYKYNSQEEAMRIAGRLKKDRLSRDIIFKDYSVLLSDEKNLILIKAGCSSPENQWSDIIDKIKKFREPLLTCRCGGFCDV